MLDKWDLHPGNDPNVFMESMVSDPTVTKVVMIFDKIYVEKSNSRRGGAGTEAQILTPELYAKSDQSKFAAIIRERDENGNPYRPTYYGSRLYFDLTNPTKYSEEFERVIRWVFNKPLHLRPQMGQAPSFVTESTGGPKLATSVAFRRAVDAVKNNTSASQAATVEFFETVVRGLEQFRINRADTRASGVPFDDKIVENIEAFTPYRNEVIELVATIARYNPADYMHQAIHRFLEKTLTFFYAPEGINSWTEGDYDNFKFIIHEIFLYVIAIYIREEKFDGAAYMLENEYYSYRRNGESALRPYPVFRNYLRTLDEERNRRIPLNRLSVRADMLKERSKGTGLDFKYLMAADFIAYLRSLSGSEWDFWWPDTCLYAAGMGRNTPFELFTRAKSVKYFDRIKGLLGVKTRDELGTILEKLQNDPRRIPKWQFENINPSGLVGWETLATAP